MKNQLLHVFRNTPFGREIFLQSLYFCKMTGLQVKVFIPKHPQFLMYFPREVVTVDVDKSFLHSPGTARKHAEELIREAGVDGGFLEPKRYTASTLPDIPGDFGFMTCPRTISDLSSKVGLGYIGPRVRAIIKNATFPVLIPTPVYKKWKRILVLFGGSTNALKAFRFGVKLQLLSGLPLRLFTYAEKKPRAHYEKILEEHNLLSGIRAGGMEWKFIEKGTFREGLYEVSHNALVVAGAYGHGIIRELLFGNMLEEIQTILPNNLVIVGPYYTET